MSPEASAAVFDSTCPCSIETTAVFSWILRDEPLCGWCMFDCGCTILEKTDIAIFLTLRYILLYENIQEFSSDDLNSALCYVAFQNDKHLKNSGAGCASVTIFSGSARVRNVICTAIGKRVGCSCRYGLCRDLLWGKCSSTLVVLPLVVATDATHCRHRTRVRSISSLL